MMKSYLSLLAALRGYPLKPSGPKMLLMYLASYADPDGSQIEPGIGRITEETALAKASAIKYLQALIANTILFQVSGGNNRANAVYAINLLTLYDGLKSSRDELLDRFKSLPVELLGDFKSSNENFKSSNEQSDSIVARASETILRNQRKTPLIPQKENGGGFYLSDDEGAEKTQSPDNTAPAEKRSDEEPTSPATNESDLRKTFVESPDQPSVASPDLGDRAIESVTSSESVVLFESVAAIYPRAEELKKAKQVWLNDHLHLRHDEIVAGIERHKAHNRQWRDHSQGKNRVPYLWRFLDGERWVEIPDGVVTTPKAACAPGTHEFDDRRVDMAGAAHGCCLNCKKWHPIGNAQGVAS